MTFHISFALAKNVQIILQERERQVPNQAWGWTDTDATFHVTQTVQQRSPCLKYERKQRAWKRIARNWAYLRRIGSWRMSYLRLDGLIEKAWSWELGNLSSIIYSQPPIILLSAVWTWAKPLVSMIELLLLPSQKENELQYINVSKGLALSEKIPTATMDPV